MKRRSLFTLGSSTPEVGDGPTSVEGRFFGGGAAAPSLAPSPGRSLAARRFPNVSVQDQHGGSFRFYDDLIRDKIVMINFMYTRCEGICPTQTMNLKATRKLLGKRVDQEIFMYSISLKPWEDSPEVLSEYTGSHGIEEGWKFLTGTREDIERLRVAMGFADLNPEIDRDITQHTGIMLYGSDKLNRWAGCPADAAPDFIVNNVLSIYEPVRKYVPEVAPARRAPI